MYSVRRRFVRQRAENNCDKSGTSAASECILLYTHGIHYNISQHR